MRLAGAIALIALLVAGLSASAGAGTSERATAFLVTGTQGDHGGLTSRSGTDRGTSNVDAAGVGVASGELLAQAGGGAARALAAARSVRLLDGLVTAYGVRREARGTRSDTTYAGRVSGLRIDGKDIGAVGEPATYPLPGDVGSVTVNAGGAGLELILAKPYKDFPAGTRIVIADVSVKVTQTQDVPRRTPTPERTATPDKIDGNDTAEQAGKRKRKPPTAEQLARRAARRAARERLMNGPFVFPVFGPASFSDDWGAPRQIGAHQGNDIFAPFGAPVVAVADGEIFKVGTLPISGNRLWLRADTGDTFFYAHLSSFAPGAVNGRRVKAGALLGFVGNTGDAEPTPPHVHFEVHPGDGSATNPFRIISVWQSNPSPAARSLARYGGAAEEPGALVEVRDFIAG